MKNRKMHSRIFIGIIFLFCTQLCVGQTIFGKWRTIDDETRKEKGIVEIYEENGLVQAKILQVLEKGREDAVCIKCKGELKGQPVKGMQIIRNFKPAKNGEYKGSYLLDPESGSVYRGKVWLDSDDKDKLKVRG
ncbi:MAG: DUF2147 domain-containing protein, partial [Allomuricauda sp.]